MADKPKKDTKKSPKVQVDTATLRQAADRFDTVSTYLNPFLTPLKNPNIAPGDFADATLLQAAIKNAVGVADTSEKGNGVLGTVGKLNLALKGIADNLITIATAYDQAEDDNKDEGTRLKGLTENLDKALLGDSDVTVPADPKTLPPLP